MFGPAFVNQFDTVYSIHRLYKLPERPAYLDISNIGWPCLRKQWYSMRFDPDYALPISARQEQIKQQHKLTMLEELSFIGVNVQTPNFQINHFNGQLSGSMDASGLNFAEAPKTWHVVQLDCLNDASFRQLSINKEIHGHGLPDGMFQKLQSIMAITGMTRAFYLAENMNTGQLFKERVRYSAKVAKKYINDAHEVIISEKEMDRISDNPEHKECLQCPWKNRCHFGYKK